MEGGWGNGKTRTRSEDILVMDIKYRVALVSLFHKIVAGGGITVGGGWNAQVVCACGCACVCVLGRVVVIVVVCVEVSSNIGELIKTMVISERMKMKEGLREESRKGRGHIHGVMDVEWGGRGVSV